MANQVNDIDDSFVEEFTSDVHMAYQRQGAQLLNSVRRKTGVKGTRTTFQKAGTGAAGTKSRNGDVPIINRDHDPITVSLTDYYAGEYIDQLDELKINHDEKMVAANSIAWAMGRKSDELITDACTSITAQTTDTGGVTQAKAEEIYEAFGENSVANDGERYVFVSPQGWTDMLSIDGFSNADYIGADDLPFKNIATAKFWMGFKWVEFSGLDKTGNVRASLAWHRTAVGHASGMDPDLRMEWVPQKRAYLASSAMSQGAIIIDQNGCYRLRHTEA